MIFLWLNEAKAIFFLIKKEAGDKNNLKNGLLMWD